MMNSGVGMETAREILREYFGYDTFRRGQEEAVGAILSGKDALCVMPTGAGKSLCYEIPAMVLPGITLVISPLVSLMQDQVRSLNALSIPSAFCNSTLSAAEYRSVLDGMTSGAYKLVYVAPERLDSMEFCALCAHLPISLIAVDEAHCVSQWGQDFRPSYRRIAGFVASLPHRPVVAAFTATAAENVRADIISLLCLREPFTCVTGFDRPNLYFGVIRAQNRNEELLHLLEKYKGRSGIVYCMTRKTVEEVCAFLQSSGYAATRYHAGLSEEERRRNQDDFLYDRKTIMVATNAFGMGIDRPDVRQVIHFNLPGSLEAYYQEAGRAGRDGENAECILLYAYRDRFVQEFLIDLSNPPPELVQELYTRLRELAIERKTTMLEVTLSELVPEVPGAKSDSQLSAAMAILEKAELIDRGFRRNNRGFLHFTEDLEYLASEHAAQATQRSRFIARCIERFGFELLQEKAFTFDELAAVSGLSTEQVKRVLRALNGECLEWRTPFAGRGTELLHPEKVQVDMDYQAMSAKREFELARLDEVCAYARTTGCRQAALIGYFGENARSWRCGSCDNCSGEPGEHAGRLREVTDAAEEGIIRRILEAVEEFDGRIGSGKLSQILAGSRSAELAGRGFHRSRHFGRLEPLKQTRIM
ncbi:MAG: RecQ family ATP-dependent DNA helicase, partial [Clostridiales bacterium]|nr:RecQ family ATP-dependent DNA helicase [Clostridiales bacterium]